MKHRSEKSSEFDGVYLIKKLISGHGIFLIEKILFQRVCVQIFRSNGPPNAKQEKFHFRWYTTCFDVRYGIHSKGIDLYSKGII